MIPIGSVVEVVSTGANYSSYTSFIREKGYGHLASKHTGNCQKGWTGTVLYNGNHLQFPNTPLCIVEINNQNRTIVVIGEYGLKIIEVPVLDEEIETSDVPLLDLIGI